MRLETNDASQTSRHDANSFAPLPDKDELRSYVIEHIDEAIEKGWIVPYYQPVVRTLTGKLCGAEALARWEDPTYGLLGPEVFIGPLEQARLVHKLDCSIIRQVCRQYRESVNIGEPIVPISFNLSRLDFDLCDVFAVVEKAVREYEVPRRMLNIEITETILGTDPAYMSKIMGVFHAAGYQVWMDDFGSGYSTLNVLKDFDFDELKMDMEFLNRFGEKSKIILASVVDMAKKLGIQTLAEGVETEEQRTYLQRIGCEKMQGFLFGKPKRHAVEDNIELCNAIGVESSAERLYFNDIGALNTLSLSERDLTEGSNTSGYVTSMSLAIVEFENDRFKIIDSNRVFREGLANVGIASVEEAERRINAPTNLLGRQARRHMDRIEHDKFARIDYVVGDTACVMRAKHITTRGGRIAILVSIDDTIKQSERGRHERMAESLSVLYSIYEHVDIVHLDEECIEPVFDSIGFESLHHAPKLDDAIRSFANSEIYPADRARFLAFMDRTTLIQRIQESGEKYIIDFFRVRRKGGDYGWMLFGVIHLADKPGNQVMVCTRSTHNAFDGLLQTEYGHPDDESGTVGAIDPDLQLSDGSLWRAVADSNHFAFFWKDRNRRFVGANQAFLDYYNFDSLDAILGKTDEDMGWHIDPIPFKEDELRVLNEGAHIRDRVGHCIVHGEVRDIMASKAPVYRNGRIVGLVGFFVDIGDNEMLSENPDTLSGDGISSLPLRDPVTGVFNYTGLESATWQFVDSYVKLGIDFAMISINIENYRHINQDLGYEFGDKVLAKVANVLRRAAGHRCVIGHVYAERFVILLQDATDDELAQMCADIEKRISSIAQVDGARCTIYALASYARYSEHRDIEAMKRSNRDDRLSRQDAKHSESSESDTITSTLL